MKILFWSFYFRGQNWFFLDGNLDKLKLLFGSCLTFDIITKRSFFFRLCCLCLFLFLCLPFVFPMHLTKFEIVMHYSKDSKLIVQCGYRIYQKSPNDHQMILRVVLIGISRFSINKILIVVFWCIMFFCSSNLSRDKSRGSNDSTTSSENPFIPSFKDNPGLTFLGEPGTDSKTRLPSSKIVMTIVMIQMISTEYLR